MKLEPLMYVRTNQGNIYKLKFVEEIMIINNKQFITTNNELNCIGYVTKSSFNIIDLIEIGDYVNGYYVSKIWDKTEITHYKNGKPVKRIDKMITIQAPSYGGILHLYNEDIKSILTHEQYEQNCYRVKE